LKKTFTFIYWFAFYNPDSPSVRYRGKYPLEYLRKTQGIGSCFVYPGYRISVILKFLCAYLSALFFRRKNSLIVIQKVHSDFIYANLLKLLVLVRKPNTIYDIDDADYLLFPPENIYWFCRNCSAVMAGSREIADNLKQYNANVFFNTSPAPSPAIVKKQKNNVLHIGWIGGFGGDHKESLLSEFFPALKHVPFKVKLSLLGVTEEKDRLLLTEYFSTNPNVELIVPGQIDWQNETEIQNAIAQFDIGIATLLDNEFQRSKSGFKAKQYLNHGVPVLSTDLPENNSVVIDSENGFYCNSPQEFQRRITEFHNMNEQQYAKLSGNAVNSAGIFGFNAYCNRLRNIPDASE